MKQLKVLLVNGSPHEKGCTYTALTEIKSELEKAGVLADVFYIGKDAIHGCIGCGYCKKT